MKRIFPRAASGQPRRRMSPVQMVVVGLLVLAWQGWEARQRTHNPSSAGLTELQTAYEAGQSGVMVETTGLIHKVLPDDQEGDRHQKFLLQIDGQHTVLVSHNIDIAPRVPVHPGDTVTVFGQYEWSEQGGVVHWTHRDPRGHHPNGWIRHDGQIYE